MKKNIFKQVLSAMVLTMSLAGGAAFVSANSVQYSENGDYQAAVNSAYRQLPRRQILVATVKTVTIRPLLTPTSRHP